MSLLFTPPHPRVSVSSYGLEDWCIIETPPLSGQENMTVDLETLHHVSQGSSPTIRLFEFQEPTVSFGRLQKAETIHSFIPKGWKSVQRPTGGGIVFHNEDLCISFCWPRGQQGIPTRIQDHYQWVHALIQNVLESHLSLNVATCQDCNSAPSQPFGMRQCFTTPVGYDLLKGDQKIVGGALYHTREAILYQGSIQHPDARTWKYSVRNTFQQIIQNSFSCILS